MISEKLSKLSKVELEYLLIAYTVDDREALHYLKKNPKYQLEAIYTELLKFEDSKAVKTLISYYING